MSEKRLINRLTDWFTEPLVNILAAGSQTQFDNNNIQIEVFKETPSPKEYSAHLARTFRPSTFEEYIGQNRAKSILQSWIKAKKERNEIMPHIILHGKAGCGKTTLARIIAKELGVKFDEVITSTCTYIPDLLDKIRNIEGGVLFLDEVHALPREVAESIYTAMTDYTINGENYPFTLIGATTEYGELLETRKPFAQRFTLPIELEDYTIFELTTMIKQYKNVMFPQDKVHESIFEILAQNCRYTPRIALRLLESVIYLKEDVQTTLYNFNIIKDSYTNKDLKILKYIALNDKGIGLQGILTYLETSEANYLQDIEPYLVKNELLIKTGRGRKITDKGKWKILELEGALKN